MSTNTWPRDRYTGQGVVYTQVLVAAFTPAREAVPIQVLVAAFTRVPAAVCTQAALSSDASEDAELVRLDF